MYGPLVYLYEYMIARFLHFWENMYLVRCTMSLIIRVRTSAGVRTNTKLGARPQARAEKPWPRLRPSGTHSNNSHVG